MLQAATAMVFRPVVLMVTVRLALEQRLAAAVEDMPPHVVVTWALAAAVV